MIQFCANFSHQVFDIMRKQERTRLAELEAERANQEAIQAQLNIVSVFFYRLMLSDHIQIIYLLSFFSMFGTVL